MRTIIALIQIIVAMLAILTLVLWEKRDRNSNWLLSLCLLIPMLLIPQIFEDGDNYAMCMYTDDETKGESFLEPMVTDERLAPPGQMYSEPVITPPTDSMYYTEPVDNEELASYQGLGHRNWFYDTTRHWPEPPRLTRSELMPVPRQNAYLCAPLGEIAADINEGGKLKFCVKLSSIYLRVNLYIMALRFQFQHHLMNLFSCMTVYFVQSCHISRDIAHLHLNIDTNQRLIEQCDEILDSIDQNKDLLEAVDRWNHKITSDAWQKSHRSVGIGPVHIELGVRKNNSLYG